MLFTGVLGAHPAARRGHVSRQHVLPVTLPVGVVTAAVGAPYFLLLLYRANVRV